jgi:hypothetical protein
LLSELWVAAEVLKVKAEEAMTVIEDYTETQPDKNEGRGHTPQTTNQL